MLTNSLWNRMIRKGLLQLTLAVAGVASLAACNDSLGLRASVPVQFDTLSAYSMTATPISFPAAYSASNGFVVRVDQTINFDVAFDLAPSGAVQLIPARRISVTRQVGGLSTATQRVGLQLIKGSFESLTKAPSGGYVYDSTFVVTPGQGVVVELASDICQYSLVQQIYAKLVVDSVAADRRQIYFRAIRDPNCGFRSLQSGVPKS